MSVLLIGTLSARAEDAANAEDGAPRTLADRGINGACSESEAPDEVYCLEQIAAWRAHEWSKAKGDQDECLAAGLLLNAHCEEMADAKDMNNGTIAACFGDVARMLDVEKCGGYGALTRQRALKQHAFFAKKEGTSPLSKLKIYGASEILALVAERGSAGTDSTNNTSKTSSESPVDSTPSTEVIEDFDPRKAVAFPEKYLGHAVRCRTGYFGGASTPAQNPDSTLRSFIYCNGTSVSLLFTKQQADQVFRLKAGSEFRAVVVTVIGTGMLATVVVRLTG